MQNVSSTDTLQGAYGGEGGALFGLALKTGLLTLITLGIYRFWAKTRIRRYMWSATAPGGAPFEYTGTGLEKFLGFLIAVVVLALYLGVVQLLLFFAGLTLIPGGNSQEAILRQMAATYITLFAVLPLVFFAQYRSRRYLLSRTRWRGIRFGAEQGALGYMWRALGYTLLTIVTLGLLAPLAAFKLEKYMVDRTWFGDAQFEQGGRWTMLYGSMKHIFIAVAIMIGLGVLAAVVDNPAFAALIPLIGLLWLYFGFFYFQVDSFRRMAQHKKVGDHVGFESEPKVWTVIGYTLLGALAASAALFAIIMFGALVGFSFIGFSSFEVFTNPEAIGAQEPDPTGMFIGGAIITISYILSIIVAGALILVMVSQPIISHYVTSTTILNASQLDTVRQRGGDEMVDAEGFADALDVGGGF